MTADEYVETFLRTGVGPVSHESELVASSGATYRYSALGIACARYLNGSGPDPTSSDGEAAMQFVGLIRRRLV